VPAERHLSFDPALVADTALLSGSEAFPLSPRERAGVRGDVTRIPKLEYGNDGKPLIGQAVGNPSKIKSAFDQQTIMRSKSKKFTYSIQDIEIPFATYSFHRQVS
jgi:hypothetical protein